ncbi:MAG TPA: 16S rRNA (cytosine(1402)-N(4))-methyltransferase RsmH [Candidatus Limnocylindrales bacterium]|nr:16S rRNA (cytosine(1402)-N(4))-methyltransferase RsmH [Candidatus Limnocylindrales bacterium]
MSDYHESVLLKETIEYLNVLPENKYIDATLGGGGHTLEILRLGGKVLGMDVDQDALDFVNNDLGLKIKDLGRNDNLVVVKGNFKDIDKIARDLGFENVNGIVFDLGVSSHQLQIAERGFSFQQDGPLDMRMDRDLGVKAQDLINILSKRELVELFIKLGEEYSAHSIAERIIQARKVSLISTTSELVEIVKGEYRGNFKINPATKVFQALRIAINDEINCLKISLPKAFGLIEKGGRLAVISFHSLEDRIVKNQFKDFEKDLIGKIITKKPVIPSEDEIRRNKKSRSSKLRVIEKL